MVKLIEITEQDKDRVNLIAFQDGLSSAHNGLRRLILNTLSPAIQRPSILAGFSDEDLADLLSLYEQYVALYAESHKIYGSGAETMADFSEVSEVGAYIKSRLSGDSQ